MHSLYIYWGLHTAADHIDTNPHLYGFYVGVVPESLTDRGCAVGWLNYFTHSGTKQAVSMISVENIFGTNDEFYLRMNELAPQFQHDAHMCAKGLRAYAEKYHKPSLCGWAQIILYQRRTTHQIEPYVHGWD